LISVDSKIILDSATFSKDLDQLNFSITPNSNMKGKISNLVPVNSLQFSFI